MTNVWQVPMEITIINLENLNPEFCLSLSEILFYFHKSHFSVENLDAKLCPVDTNATKILNPFSENGDFYIICHFISMALLPSNCDIIIGNLIIEAGDEVYTTKLEYTKHLIGTLVIRNTNLVEIEFLGLLSFICSLDGMYL